MPKLLQSRRLWFELNATCSNGSVVSPNDSGRDDTPMGSSGDDGPIGLSGDRGPVGLVESFFCRVEYRPLSYQPSISPTHLPVNEEHMDTARIGEYLDSPRVLVSPPGLAGVDGPPGERGPIMGDADRTPPVGPGDQTPTVGDTGGVAQMDDAVGGTEGGEGGWDSRSTGGEASLSYIGDSGATYSDASTCSSAEALLWLARPTGAVQIAPVGFSMLFMVVGLVSFLAGLVTRELPLAGTKLGEVARVSNRPHNDLPWMDVFFTHFSRLGSDKVFLQRRVKFFFGGGFMILGMAIAAISGIREVAVAGVVMNMATAIALTTPIAMLLLTAAYLFGNMLKTSQELATLRGELNESQASISRGVASLTSNIDLEKVFANLNKKTQDRDANRSEDGGDTPLSEKDAQAILRLLPLLLKLST